MFRMFNIQRSKLMFVAWRDGPGNIIDDPMVLQAAQDPRYFFARKVGDPDTMRRFYQLLNVTYTIFL
jgi:hypothetical protein